jgi:hypothetical protein
VGGQADAMGSTAKKRGLLFQVAAFLKLRTEVPAALDCVNRCRCQASVAYYRNLDDFFVYAMDPCRTARCRSSRRHDNRILKCAVAAGSGTVVTGDQHLFSLGNLRGIRSERFRLESCRSAHDGG